MLGDRLGPALISGVQRRRVRLSDVSGSLRPAMLGRQVRTESQRLNAMSERLAPALARITARRREQLAARASRFAPRLLVQDVEQAKTQLAIAAERLQNAGTRQITALRTQLAAMGRLSETLSYKATLARGYAVVRSGGEIVTTKTAAEEALGLEIEFADGRMKLGGGRAAKKAKVKPPEQGSLF